MIDRREFLKSAAGAAFAGAWLSQNGSAGIGPAKKIQAVGLQLYTVRSDMEKDFEGTIAKVAAIGFQRSRVRGVLQPHAPAS